MKTIFRFLNAGAMTVAVLAVGAVAGFAQDQCADVDGQNAVYTKFTAVYNKKTVTEMETALSSGKEFLEKYGACESVKEQADFVRPHVERIEKQLPAVRKQGQLAPLFKRFDAGITADNGDEIYVAGREILAIDPDNINIIVPLGVAGLYQSYNNNMKYADDTIRYAKLATDKLKSGVAATKKNKAGADVYGALKYEYTKQQALDQLQFAIAHLTYYGKKDQKGALPLYYEIAQGNGIYKDDPRVYQTIGSYFGAEVLRLSGEVKKLIDEQKAKATDEEKLAMEPKIKEAIGLLNGTAERAMEYYSRAYKLAKSDTPAAKTYKDALYKDLSILYEGRFNKKEGLDAYISSVTAKPLPNPTSPITPVNDPDPTTTTTSAPAGGAKPASASSTTKPVSTTGPQTKTVAAKKGTRK
ncbi:MAG TPA: hypothetical protein VFZ23_01275 [Pyrinomonadaceae bacterium]